MLVVLLLLSLCGSSVAQEVRQDEVSRYNLFMAALSACTPSGTTPSHVLCVLDQAYASELNVARMHPTDWQVRNYLLDELWQLRVARHAEPHLEARISSHSFKAVSGRVLKDLKELQGSVARVGARIGAQIRPSSPFSTLSTRVSSSRTLLGTSWSTLEGTLGSAPPEGGPTPSPVTTGVLLENVPKCLMDNFQC